jgi:hypothetical protein
MLEGEPMPATTPITCRSHGAYTDRFGVTHTMRPGDVVPDDAMSCSVDNWIAPASNGFCVVPVVGMVLPRNEKSPPARRLEGKLG